MIDLVKTIITNILTALYQPFGFAVTLSITFMFAWENYSSVRKAATQWMEWFKTDASFRKMFFLTFNSVMILFRTLLNRTMWANPVSNVIGIWGLYKLDTTKNEMVLTTEVPENIILFISFAILLIWTYRDSILGNKVTLLGTLWHSTRIVFLFSLIIEMLQLFLRLGTWQLSDLFFNTLGGFIGGLIYWIGYRIKHIASRVN